MQENGAHTCASLHKEIWGDHADGFLYFVSALCFTILGLWLVVVQQKFKWWASDTSLKRRAYGIALHFSLPGTMALLALIDPASSALWRASFAIVALGGAVVIAAVRGAAPDTLGTRWRTRARSSFTWSSGLWPSGRTSSGTSG
jgi:hypothetical protein